MWLSSPDGGTGGEVCRLRLHLVVVSIAQCSCFVSDVYYKVDTHVGCLLHLVTSGVAYSHSSVFNVLD